jgi:hypothetical protein
MESPKVVRCPDGYFRKAIFSLGPYIADYPEQVWLAGVVSNWCPKYDDFSILSSSIEIIICRCNAHRNDLDAPGSHRRTHEKTDYMIKIFDPGLLWDEFGIRTDVLVGFHIAKKNIEVEGNV